MNNREAINILKRQADGYYPEMTEALNMAIKALSVEPQEWISPTAEPVSTEEAKKLLYQEFKGKMKDGNPRLLVAYEIAMKALETQTEWISVKDSRKTKIRERVWVTDCDGEVWIMYYNDCDCYFNEFGDVFTDDIIAWQPITEPSPYKGDTE